MVQKESKPKFIAGVPLIIITGLSGAGKSTAMRFLDDLGCYCLDNLPPALIPDFFTLYEQSSSPNHGVVVVSDVRSGALFDDFTDMVKALEASEVGFNILYLDCSTQTLIDRFKEVRRAHPLKTDQSTASAIEAERKLLEPIRAIATRIIDTSSLDAAGLRQALIRNVITKESADVISLEILSFGFKYGIPRDVDFVFDVRFLPNPFYVDELRPKTGEDPDVMNYVMADPLANSYFEKICELIELTLESFVNVGKTNLTVSFGCTGGRHRSVAFARRLAEHFSNRDRSAQAIHRDSTKHQS